MGTYGYQLVQTQGDPQVWRRVHERHAGHITRDDYQYVSPPFVPDQKPPPWLWVFGNPVVAEAPDVENGMAITLFWQTTVDHIRINVFRDGKCVRSLEHCREMDPAWIVVEGQQQPWEARFLLADVDRSDLSKVQCAALDGAVMTGDWQPVADLVWPTSSSWQAVAASLGVVRVEDERVAHLQGSQPGMLERVLRWLQGP